MKKYLSMLMLSVVAASMLLAGCTPKESTPEGEDSVSPEEVVEPDTTMEESDASDDSMMEEEGDDAMMEEEDSE